MKNEKLALGHRSDDRGPASQDGQAETPAGGPRDATTGSITPADVLDVALEVSGLTVEEFRALVVSKSPGVFDERLDEAIRARQEALDRS